MPAMTETHRPEIQNADQMAAYLAPPASAAPDVYMRRDWQQFLQEDLGWAWPPARFGHSVQEVSTTRVLVYGGVGCGKYDNVTNLCIELKILDDLWEMDTVQGRMRNNPFRELDLSPRLPGLVGMTAVPLGAASHQIYVLGGSSSSFVLDLMLGLPLNPSADNFEFRNLEFRARKALQAKVTSEAAISGHSEVSNATLAILFGGFSRNLLTSAVYFYDLQAASPEIALSRSKALASGPVARSFTGVAKPDDSSLMMFGGVNSEVGISDLWMLDLNTQAWSEVHATSSSAGPRANSFPAFESFDLDGNTVLVVSGGIGGGFADGLTFIRRLPVDFQHPPDAPNGPRRISSAVYGGDGWGMTVLPTRVGALTNEIYIWSVPSFCTLASVLLACTSDLTRNLILPSLLPQDFGAPELPWHGRCVDASALHRAYRLLRHDRATVCLRCPETSANVPCHWSRGRWQSDRSPQAWPRVFPGAFGIWRHGERQIFCRQRGRSQVRWCTFYRGGCR